MNDSSSFQRAFKPMTAGDFRRLSEFIRDECGIKMPPGKKVMLEARLQKRLRSLGLGSFREYCEHVFGAGGENGETIHMINAVTTNKTDFFREPFHFEFLMDTELPLWAAASGPGRTFATWSAGCATGEEPYTLAMVLRAFADGHPGFRFSVLATDISTSVLDRAQSAIYEQERVAAVPPELRRRFLLRSKDRSRGLVRIVPELRSLVQFQRLNLLADGAPFPRDLDAVFCRNVLIYFDRPTQARLLKRICGALRPGGILFLGHSESTHGMDLPLVRLASTIYRVAS